MRTLRACVGTRAPIEETHHGRSEEIERSFIQINQRKR